MTLRHLFYRLVSSKDPDTGLGMIPNTEVGYTKVKNITRDARWSGEIRFDQLFDGLREARKPSTWSGLPAFMRTVKQSYALDHWKDQTDYVEVWCEKDAIISVFDDITEELQVTVRSLRGFNSLSACHQAATDLLKISKPITIYYLGDHDPSGENIAENAEDNLRKMFDFLDRPFKDFDFERIAVFPEDIKAFNLQTVPTKKGDTRTKDFHAIHGEVGVELDALPMSEIRERVESAIWSHIDMDAWSSCDTQEEEDVVRLGTVTDQLASEQN